MVFKKHIYFLGIIALSGFFLLTSFKSIVNADYQTNLLSGYYLQDSSGVIDVGLYSIPVVYDWNDDGTQDLLVGQRFDDIEGSHGYVSYYENTGSNASPYLTSPAYIEEACATTCNLDVAAGG